MRLRRDRIAVALDHRVLVYNFADLRLIYQWETIHNGKGLLAMSSQVDKTVVACPGVHAGQVRPAHARPCACDAWFALSGEGTTSSSVMLACAASLKGLVCVRDCELLATSTHGHERVGAVGADGQSRLPLDQRA